MKKIWILFLFTVPVFDALQSQVENNFQIGIYGLEKETCMHEYINGCKVPVLNTDTIVNDTVNNIIKSVVYNTSTFNVLAEDGFNTVHTYCPIMYTTERWLQRFIQLCGNNGLKMVVSLKGAYYQPDANSNFTGTNTYNSLGHSFGPCDSPEQANQSRPNIDQLMNNVFTVSPYKDIISGFYMADEPSALFGHQYTPEYINKTISEKKVEVPPLNVQLAMNHVKTKLANKGIFDKDIILCDGNHWRSIHDNINDGSGVYNPQDYVKLLKRTDKRDVFWDDAYQSNAILYASEHYNDIKRSGPAGNAHYLGAYKGLEYEQQYTQTAHKVISIYINDDHFPRGSNIHVDTSIENANLLRFQTYTSVIHGAKGIWFWGLIWCTTPEEYARWLSDDKDRFCKDSFPEVYTNYVSPLARELRFLVEKNVLSTDPGTIIATKTDTEDPLRIVPPINNNPKYLIFRKPNETIPAERKTTPYSLRYTIRTNGEEAYMIITNPLNYPVAALLDFNVKRSGNPFLKYLDSMELMFEESLPILDSVVSATYKTNTKSCVDWQNGTVTKKVPIKFKNQNNKKVFLCFGPLDVKVLRLIPKKGVAQNLDLCIRETTVDDGREPSLDIFYPYLSPDIWVRNQDDDLVEHQNAEYDGNEPVYVYVRVFNNSFKPSTDKDSVSLYWSFGGTVHEWPHVWNGDRTANVAGNEVTLGGFVSTEPLPVLQPGQSAIVKFRWMAPDPLKFPAVEFSDGIPQGHFCLLANIVSEQDPTEEYDNTHEFVVQNNNVGWKNVSVVDAKPNTPKRIPLHWIYSSKKNPVSARLVLRDCEKEKGNPITGEAEIILHTNAALGDLIYEKGLNMEGFKEYDKYQWIIPAGTTQAGVDIPLTSDDIYMAGVEFRFLTEEVTEPKEYSCFLYTEDVDKGQILGGTEMKIRRYEKDLFTAKAGQSRTILYGDSTILSAQSIGEEATYVWRDIANDTLLAGQEITVAPSANNSYSLSVLTPDGYIDYDTVSVSVKDSYIKTISPNPARHQAVVSYHIKSGHQASLQVLDISGNLVAVYPLAVGQTETTLTVANWTPGSYSFVLLVSGAQSDMKTLVIQ